MIDSACKIEKSGNSISIVIDRYDKVKYTWLRYVLLFMCRYPFFRAKWFLYIFRNYATHKLYLRGKIIKKYYLNDFTGFK